jgi:tryptophan-rich sensory protein
MVGVTGPVGNSVSAWSRRVAALAVLVGFGASAIALAAAPKLMPVTYSWIEHTTSESAAQGVDGAWLARLGFLFFGFSVIWLSRLASPSWGTSGTALHLAFAVFMIAAAAFSVRSWEETAGFDPVEDLLHSTAATAMGFAFAFGVLIVMLQRARPSSRHRILDAIAIGAAIAIPLGMIAFTGHAGVLQRAMFLVAYVWYGGEALRAWRQESRAGYTVEVIRPNLTASQPPRDGAAK